MVPMVTTATMGMMRTIWRTTSMCFRKNRHTVKIAILLIIVWTATMVLRNHGSSGELDFDPSNLGKEE